MCHITVTTLTFKIKNTMENVTPEEVQRHVSAAFDSVALVEDVVAGTRMVTATLADRVGAVERNVGHLNIMVAKDWFVAGMTSEQSDQLNAAIASGEAFVTDNTPAPVED
jgi:hypothetical protein